MMRIKEYRGSARLVTFGQKGRRGKEELSLWESSVQPGAFYMSHDDSWLYIQVPSWIMASFRANAPIEPILDYILENGLAPPCLAAAIEATYSGANT